MTAAAGPNERFTARKSTPTVRHADERLGQQDAPRADRPKSRTERPMTIVESGGLSTVMKLLASKLPKNQADQLCDAGQRGRRVVRVGVAADGQVPDVQDGRERENPQRARAGPTPLRPTGRERCRRAGRERSASDLGPVVMPGSETGGHRWVLSAGESVAIAGAGDRRPPRLSIARRSSRKRTRVASALAATSTAISPRRPRCGATNVHRGDARRGDGERDAQGQHARGDGRGSGRRRPRTSNVRRRFAAVLPIAVTARAAALATTAGASCRSQA